MDCRQAGSNDDRNPMKEPHMCEQAMCTGMAGVWMVFAFIGFSVIAFIWGFMK